MRAALGPQPVKRGYRGATTISRLESVALAVAPEPSEAETAPLIVARPELLLEARTVVV